VSTEEAIEQFCAYFNDQVEIIDALSIDQEKARGTYLESHQIRFYQKVVLITQIDTLAGIRYPKERYPQLNKKNHEHFIVFVKEHDIWPEGRLASIPFLLEAAKSGKFSNGKLKEFVVRRHAEKYDEGSFNIDFSEIDIPNHELVKLCSTEQEEKAVKENTHYELLYRYRNYLVHEARVPGNAMEVTNDERPYYHGYIGEERLFLAYPLPHFMKLVNQAIATMRVYLMNNQLNPYDFVSETTRW